MLRTTFQHGRDAALVYYGLKTAIAMPATASRLINRVTGPAKKALGIGALGAAGAIGYGLHKQNDEERERNSLVYAPMSGSFTG